VTHHFGCPPWATSPIDLRKLAERMGPEPFRRWIAQPFTGSISSISREKLVPYCPSYERSGSGPRYEVLLRSEPGA
jgi:hypothetical protein